ncbi:hypothetical protein [Pontibacter vulgaris]|uniref:hypothetical protein n=1 Tax=Pontibacter vulgaris TaxID=2905679 RepID=UPI001FA70E0D|nr:hypothetical protein [Pontibacter vulgaris]
MPLLHLLFRIKMLPCLLGLLLLCVVCQAQVKPKTDTTRTDTTYQKFDERIMKNLRQMSERKTIMGKLLKSILVFDRVEEEVTGLDAELIEQEYEKHNYKIVRRIDIRTLDAFGYSINDTSRVPRNALEKAANSVHIKTGRGLIRNKLLFKKNEPLEPLALVESERLLRQTEYLLDARIVVNELTSTNDSVDVFVVTKDVFSIGGSGSYSPSSGSGRISLRDLNFLGQGHQVRTTYRFNMDRPRPWELAGYYTVENIGKTYVSADINYVDQNYYKEKSAYLRRDFFSTNTKYAGAVGMASIEELILIPSTPQDTIAHYEQLGYLKRDMWIGRSFKFKTYNLGYEPRSRLIVGLRLTDTDYSKIPTTNFQDNTVLLGSVGYSLRRYYKDRFLYGFGRTEDIPAGTLFMFTAGYEKGVVASRRYFGVESSFAKYSTGKGYFYGRAAYGSFIRDDNWEQGVLDLETLYFTRLYENGNWKLRQFIIGRGTFGINRNPEDLININNENGLRGFRSDMLRGSRRVVLNYEANLYTPLSLLGFRLAALAFADVAWLSSGNTSSPFKEKPFQGYGIGFRFRNEYLSFSTIQVLFAYYPKLPDTGNYRDYKIYESSRPYYDFADFRFRQPGTVSFR